MMEHLLPRLIIPGFLLMAAIGAWAVAILSLASKAIPRPLYRDVPMQCPGCQGGVFQDRWDRVLCPNCGLVSNTVDAVIAAEGIEQDVADS